MASAQLQTDIAIIGGGIAGLWTLNQLRNQGYSAILFEQEALGSYQTIGSQGMIHGGIKYALGGALSGGSEAISAMPDRWRAALAGKDKVDIQKAQVLSKDFFLWSNSTVQSRLSSFFASKMLRGRVDKLDEPEYPAPFKHPLFSGQVYRLVDLVMDMPSLVSALADQHREAIFKIDWTRAKLSQDNGEAKILLPDLDIKAQKLILTAGTGNEALLAELGSDKPAMQKRPLQQVLVKHQYRESLYAHCMGGNASPRLTISTHQTAKGEPVWYLGGDLATEGTDDSPEILIARAQRELGELLPWIDFGETHWCTIKLDRAEPRQRRLLRPDQSFVGKSESLENVLTAWPTKLTLSPHLADEIERVLIADSVLPKHTPDLGKLASLGRPHIAATCWDTFFK